MNIKFEDVVKAYASEQKDYVFHNIGDSEAVVIFDNLFRNASTKVRITANSFWNNAVVNDIVFNEALRLFLEKDNTSFDLMLSNFPLDEVQNVEANNIYRMIYSTKAHREGRVRIHLGLGRSFTTNNTPIHFCTADTRMYRLEEDINTKRATCNFNDPITTKSLENAFDAVFESLDPIVLSDVLH